MVMYVWYWTASYPTMSCSQFDCVNHAWTDEDFIDLCIVRPSDCCLMIPPETWDCE